MNLACKLRLHWLLDDVGIYQHAPGGWWRCKSCDRKLFKDNAVYVSRRPIDAASNGDDHD